MGRLVAAADIGSNTAHLLVASVTQSGLKRLVNTSEWLSLGQVVATHGHIPKDDVRRLVGVMRSFRETIESYGVLDSYFFATEAVRRAENHEEVLRTIWEKAGVRVKVISPQREAELSHRAIQTDTAGDDPTLMVEAGGGSVQVAYCSDGAIQQEFSLAIGTGALTAAAKLTHPATQEQMEALYGAVRQACEAISSLPAVARIVGCGGVARGLWRALHPDGERTVEAQELAYLLWDCQRLEPKTISARYDVRLERAKTLVPGSAVFLEIMAQTAHDSMTVSQFGVREGAVLELTDRMTG